jgi:membrane protease subunit HflK
MISGDYNIVNVEFFVEYKVSDPEKYLYSSYEPEVVLRNLVQSQIRNVVGSTNVDAVLTDGKEAVQMQVRELIIAMLEEYDIGLMLTDVKIQDSEPPTEDVISAFKAVETAKQNAETVINEAKAYENSELPAANAKADSLIQNAEYLKQKRINEAIEQVAMFEAMYSEYALNRRSRFPACITRPFRRFCPREALHRLIRRRLSINCCPLRILPMLKQRSPAVRKGAQTDEKK